MPSVAVKLYSVYFKLLLKHKLQSQIQNQISKTSNSDSASDFGVTSRSDESIAAANPSFASDGVATKDIHIDPLTALSIRIFLPDPSSKLNDNNRKVNANDIRRSSYSVGSDNGSNHSQEEKRTHRRSSLNGSTGDLLNNEAYQGYLPSGKGANKPKKLPVVLQFHGGLFVAGSNMSVANDLFCRRIAKLLDVIVVAVGYRLAPECRYPAAFEDGMKVLNWIGKQANLASLGDGGVKREGRKGEEGRRIVDTFGAASVEPWLAAHGDPSRCVLLGVSCGANIADYVARKAVESQKFIEPVKVVAQVLMYPFFIGSVPTHSELKLANSYFYDKSMCMLAWRLFLPESEFDLDHPAANPLIPGRGPPLRHMPPTLTVVAEHDWMKDRAIAYSEELRKVNVDAPVLEYKDAVHEFATLSMLLSTPQAQACAEDIAIWVKKHISLRGHEFSY